MPPFTAEQFLDVFVAYNAAIWPLQIFAYGLCLSAWIALCYRNPGAKNVILSILALMWAFNGIGYHFLFFAAINPVANGFAALFILQGTLLCVSVFMPNDLRVEAGSRLRTAAGLSLIVYAVLIYELLGYLGGHGLMAGPLVGVAPCPTTIFTIGLLLLMRARWVVWLSIIPVLWSMVGLGAAMQLGIPEDFGLPVAGLVLTLFLALEAFSNRRPGNSVSARASPT